MFNPISAITNTIGGIYNAYTDRKKSKETATAKLKYKRETGDQTVTFTDQEWEAISKMNEDGSWKDEYVTLVITAPFVALYLCVFIAIYTGSPAAQEAAEGAMKSIKELIPSYGTILEVVIYAAVSIKGIKSVVRR